MRVPVSATADTGAAEVRQRLTGMGARWSDLPIPASQMTFFFKMCHHFDTTFQTNPFFIGKISAFYYGRHTMFKFFSVFLKDAATRFTRIARSVRGHIKPEDLHADAWIVAAELSEKRGREIDFADPVDQELVLNRIYWKIKDQRDWRLESAYSIDDDREGATPWADRLPAPSSMIPLEILLAQEEMASADAELAASYSQAKAYVVALNNFKGDRARLCAHLVISDIALLRRERNALQTVIEQWALFGGIEIIDHAFTPTAGRDLKSKVAIEIEAEQREIAF